MDLMGVVGTWDAVGPDAQMLRRMRDTEVKDV
jgi:hypothetical protein